MRKVIAVDLGGTNLRVAVVEGNKILKYIKKNTPKDKDELLREMEESISQLITKEVKTIGIGSPGPLANGVILNPPNLPFRNFNLKKYLENKFHKKVVIENDAKCVAFSELKLGCKKKNFIILTLGTGIGGGIIIDGKLYTGYHGYAGEICGIVLNNGKNFEDLWKEARTMMKEHFGKEIFMKDLIKMNSPESNRILGHIINTLSQGIASLINVFDPEVVILMGGAREAGKPFLDMIKKQIKKYIVLPTIPDIQWSKQSHPGIMGASLLVR